MTGSCYTLPILLQAIQIASASQLPHSLVLSQDVTVTVLCYTLPILLQAGREAAAGAFGTACTAYLGVAALLVVGSSAYSHRWPERWSPGSFDLLGNSHQVRGAACVGVEAGQNRCRASCWPWFPGLYISQWAAGRAGWAGPCECPARHGRKKCVGPGFRVQGVGFAPTPQP